MTDYRLHSSVLTPILTPTPGDFRPQGASYLLGSLLLQLRGNMSVNVHGRAYLGVAQNLHRHPCGNTLGGHEGSGSVP